MAAFDFPNSPNTNDVHTENGVSFKWDGTVWKRQSGTGAQGPTGSTGAQGATGPTGAQGQKGAQAYISDAAPSSGVVAGDLWWDSDSGDFSIYFDDGSGSPSAQWVEVGSTGPTGPTGPTGSTGAQGATGPTGAQGATAAAGAQGAAGVQGAVGATGAQGATGSTGAQGTAGSSATISNNAATRIITGGSGTNLTASPNFTYSNQKVSIVGSQKELLGLQSTHTQGPQFSLSDSSGAFSYLGSAKSLFTGGSVTDLGLRSENSLAFGTNGNNERVRITSGGKVNIGGDFNQSTYNLSVYTASGASILAKSGSSTHSTANIWCHNDTANWLALGVWGSSANTSGLITANDGLVGSNNDLSIYSTNASGNVKFGAGSGYPEHMRLTSGGQLNIGSNLTQTTYVCEVSGAYNKHGMRVVSGAPNYQDPFVVASSTGGERFRVKGGGTAQFNNSVGIQTTNIDSANLSNPVGAGHSLVGLYIGDGSMMFSSALSRTGGYYISTDVNALNAGPVTLNSNMKLDGTWVIV